MEGVQVSVLHYLAANLGLRIASSLYHLYGTKCLAATAAVSGVWYLVRHHTRTGGPRPEDSAQRSYWGALANVQRALASWYAELADISAKPNTHQPRLPGACANAASKLRQAADGAFLQSFRSPDTAWAAAWLHLATSSKETADNVQESASGVKLATPSALREQAGQWAARADASAALG